MTVKEIRDYIKNEHEGKPLYPKEDQWVAGFTEDG